MKFNKLNIFHYFIFIFGYLIFIVLFFVNTFINTKSNEDIILYGHKLYGNLKSLYGVLENEYDCYFLTLDYKIYKKYKSQNIKVIYGLNIKDIIKVINSKIFVADHGIHYFKKLLSKNKKIFIDVNHGLPMQKWNEKIVSQWYGFTEVWLMSNMHKQIYVNDFGYKEKDNLFVTGYGRLDYLKEYKNNENRKLKKVEIIKKYNLDENKQTVLYAPTWIHNSNLIKNDFMNPKNNSFIKFLDTISSNLNINLIFRPHLNTVYSKNDVSFINALKNISFMPQDKYDSVEDFLVISDILITDYSSIAFDYMLLDRPVLFLNTPSSFNLGLFKEDFFRFGKVSDKFEIESNLNKYLSEPSLYFSECPQHKLTSNQLYDDKNLIASNVYLDRIKNFYK